MFWSVSCMNMLVQQILKVCNNSCYLQTCSAVVVAGVVTVIIYSFHSNKVTQSCRVFCTTLVLPLHVLCIFPRNVTFIYDQTTLLSEEMKMSVNSLGTCPSQGELRQWVSSSFLACRQRGLIAFCVVETKSRCLLLLEAYWLLPRPTSFVFTGLGAGWELCTQVSTATAVSSAPMWELSAVCWVHSWNDWCSTTLTLTEFHPQLYEQFQIQVKWNFPHNFINLILSSKRSLRNKTEEKLAISMWTKPKNKT